MSAEFQHTLGGRSMQDTYAGEFSSLFHWISLIGAGSKDVAIGSAVTVRHVNTQGGYLHSHAHNYPGGSGRTFFLIKVVSVFGSTGKI